MQHDTIDHAKRAPIRSPAAVSPYRLANCCLFVKKKSLFRFKYLTKKNCFCFLSTSASYYAKIMCCWRAILIINISKLCVFFLRIQSKRDKNNCLRVEVMQDKLRKPIFYYSKFIFYKWYRIENLLHRTISKHHWP